MISPSPDAGLPQGEEEPFKWIGALDLTEQEMNEITEKPELLHLYNARLLWQQILAGQSAQQRVASEVADWSTR